MSEKSEARWEGVDETDGRFLQVLFAAEELEKLGFKRTALRYDQIEKIGVPLGLSDDHRRPLRSAIAQLMGRRSERQPGLRQRPNLSSQ